MPSPAQPLHNGWNNIFWFAAQLRHLSGVKAGRKKKTPRFKLGNGGEQKTCKRSQPPCSNRNGCRRCSNRYWLAPPPVKSISTHTGGAHEVLGRRSFTEEIEGENRRPDGLYDANRPLPGAGWRSGHPGRGYRRHG